MKMTFLVILTVLLAGAGHASEFVYIRSLKADLYAEPSFAAKHLGVFPQGTELIKLDEQDRWYLVQVDQVTGWVAKLLVAAKPGQGRDTAIKADSEIGSNARRRASAVATAGAARGLAADDRRRQSEDETTDYRALAAMEGQSLSEAEVIDFLEKGLSK